MARTKRQKATTDILSVCIIHKILCYLSYEEASRMRILSKNWVQAWLNLPNLSFKFKYISQGGNTVDAIMERYREEKIPIDKFEFSNRSRSCDSDQIFPQIDKWLDIALQNCVKDIVYGFTQPYHFPIIQVLAGKSLREFVLSGCDLMHVSLSSGAAHCPSLIKFSVSNVSLDENVLKNLLHSCPLIVFFILEYCLGLGKIELLNLQKIKSISITTTENERVKIQAPTLEHLSSSNNGYLLKNLDVVECQNMKSLHIKIVSISGGILDNLISRSQSLKVLKIWYCEGIRDIDSSNLESLEYTGNQILELKMTRESSQLKHSKIVLQCSNKLYVAWFCKLRKFLSYLTSSSQVLLNLYKCNDINMKELQLHHIVATPQVDILDVFIAC